MTKQDFQALAWSLFGTQPTSGSDLEARYHQWLTDVGAIAGACKVSNERFDLERFVAACKDGTR